MARLLVFRDDAVEREVELGATPVRIGRGAECDLVLEDPSKGVSRCHAELRYEAGRYVLVDLESQNGIWKDGARVARAAFQRNTTVTVGPYRLMVDESVTAPGSAGSGDTFGDATRLVPPGRATSGGEYSGGTSGSHSSASSGRLHEEASRPGLLRTHATKFWIAGGGLLAATAITLLALSIDSTEDRVRKHISKANILLGQNEPQLAITELDRALELDPTNTEALELKAQAEGIKPPDVLPPLGTPGEGKGDSAPLGPPRGGGNELAPLRPSGRGQAQGRGGAGSGERPVATVDPRAVPGDPSAERARENLARAQQDEAKRQAAAALSQGDDDVANRRWADAARNYDRAQALDPTIDLGPHLKQMTAKKLEVALELLRQADFAYTFKEKKRDAEALQKYQEAVPLLPHDHPRLKQVNERIMELKK